ncbi:NAD(P)-binding protein [Mytilinidion resinicola]|uniref:NAD(P)-binding protein n=1 Tax=Mytilinidion resinicola TaxID=574789 RepID=A0A6A6Z2K2_9PEZI|nr:NAD(P)-binding protein [Mytilinidion resinicola]KAF2814405.1 NAD(P)-binding protein [Mytilinidion resinicola]
MASQPGKVVILTGASRGIGLAIAHFLLKQKCNLVVVARSKEPLEALRKEYPDQVQVLAGDLSDFSLGHQAVELATSTWSEVDALILNHGVLDPVKRVSDTDAEEWRSSFDVNVFSVVALVKAALPALRATHGRIIFTSSGAAVSSYSTWGAYGASKAVLNHMASTLATEEPKVTTLSVRPGTVDTEMQREIRELHHRAMDKKDAEKFASLHSSGTLLKPEQPGHVIARLALDAPNDLSGKFLNWNDKDLAKFQET